jgi:hypothetical protein
MPQGSESTTMHINTSFNLRTILLLLSVHSFYIAHYLILQLLKALYTKKINKIKLKLQKAKSNIQNKTIYR